MQKPASTETGFWKPRPPAPAGLRDRQRGAAIRGQPAGAGARARS